jgi:PAS domain S-box-containing protein
MVSLTCKKIGRPFPEKPASVLLRLGRLGLLFHYCLFVSLVSATGAGAGAKRVLILYSEGRNFAPWGAIASAFQTELAEAAEHSGVPIEVYEVSLPGPLIEPSEADETTLKYLQTLIGERKPDLIVPFGGPAVGFTLRLRPLMFSSTPLLLASVPERYLHTVTLDANTATVVAKVDFPGQIKHILRILPGTTNIAVVLGSSRSEVFLKQELQREFTGFTKRLGFTWLDQYSLPQMQQQVGQLPPHTVIYCIAMLADAAGVPYEYEKVIKALHATANAPMESMCESALGLGIVGGPMTDPLAEGQKSAGVAVRILNGERPGDIHLPPVTVGTPMYDSRELRRWKISESRLPPGSVIRFREPTIWGRYGSWILSGVSIFVIQAVLIGALVANLVKRRKVQRSLRQSEERMKLAADAGDLRLWEWDTATDQVWVGGPLVARIGPRKSDHIKFRDLFQSVHPDDRSAVDLALGKCFKGDGRFENVHRRILPEDGAVIWIAVRGRVEFDKAHKPLRMRGMSMDITARKEAEQRARESEGRFLLIANSAPVMMWASGTDKMCTFVNRSWLDFTGRRLEQDLGNGWAESIHPEDRSGCVKTYVDSFDAREPFTMEYRLRRHDGLYRWISDHGVPRYDQEQNFLGYIGSCFDITEKKDAEERARESEGRFLVMANSAPVLMWASGPDKLCTFFNQPWLEFTGRSMVQELGNGWAEGVHLEDLAACMKVYVESFEARRPFTMEYRLRRHDGQYRWISDYGVPRFDQENNFLGYIGSCVDVTERKDAEAKAQQSQQELAHVSRVSMLGELAGALAHELSQPLTAVVSSAEAAQRMMNGDRGHDEELRDTLKDVVGEGRRAGEIIAGMRAMLQKEPGEMVVQDVNMAVREVLAMVNSDLVTRHVTPVLRLDPLLPPVTAHSVQLRQVLLNLVMNACDAMSEVTAEQRQLTIESRHITTKEVEVLVADNGPGFSDGILEHLFEPFHTTKPKGLGLGLAICQSIVAAHGGRMLAANVNGRGAMVRLTLPAANQ